MTVKNLLMASAFVAATVGGSTAAFADCTIQEVTPYMYKGDARLSIYGEGLQRYWRDPRAYLAGFKNKLDKTRKPWLRGGQIKIWKDGSFEAKLKVDKEQAYLRPSASVLLELEQYKDRTGYTKIYCATPSLLSPSQWRSDSVDASSVIDSSDELIGDADSTVFLIPE